MKRSTVWMTLVLIPFVLTTRQSYAESQGQDEPMEVLAKRLAERLVAKKQDRVTILDFTDIQNRTNELGRYLALQLANELVNLGQVSVLDRANLETIMAEHKLTAEGLLRPEEAKKLGQFAGVDGIVIGTVTLMGDNVEIMVRGISTNSSEIVASGTARLPATNELRRMLGLKVDSGTSRIPGGGIPTATEGAAIATREVGPITAVLQNVTEYSVQMQTRRDPVNVPAIRCTFSLENRSLQHWVAIAVNQRVLETDGHNHTPGISSAGYRGSITDRNRTAWALIEVSGVSGMGCFDTGVTQRGTRRWIAQRNPGGIVEYIRNAKRFSGADLDRAESGRYWFGSFSSIPPGQEIRMTLSFVPTVAADQEKKNGGTPEHPDYFQFDMEFVLGTFAEGEDPLKAKDLMLRNFVIDRVVLGNQSTTPEP